MDESILHGIFWNHLVYPELSSAEVDDPAAVHAWMVERLPSGAWPEYAVCVAVDGVDSLDAADRRDAVRNMREVICAHLAASQRALLGFAHTNTLYFCGNCPGARQAFLERLGELTWSLSETSLLSCTVGVAFLPDTTLAGFQWAAQHAIVAQRQKVRTGPNRVYVCDESTPSTSLGIGTYWSLAQRLHAVIKHGHREETEAVLAEATHTLFQEAYLSLSHLRPLLQSQVIFMAQAATEVMADADAIARLSESVLTQIATAFDYDRLRNLLSDAAFSFTELVHDQYHKGAHRLAAAVDEYICANLADADLSLMRVAEQVGLSGAHISRTYKNATGTGINRSINTRRVEWAKRLLLDSGASITSVAFDTGFGSLQAFGRVFREITGTTPSAYRAARIA